MADRTDRDEEIAALRGELDALRGLVSALDADVRRAQHHVDLTMRGQLRCRACGGRKIGHAPQILDGGGRGSNESMALFRPNALSSKGQGKLEAYVCMRCGLVEWWVGDPGALVPHEEYLIVNDGEVADAKDPYR